METFSELRKRQLEERKQLIAAQIDSYNEKLIQEIKDKVLGRCARVGSSDVYHFVKFGTEIKEKHSISASGAYGQWNKLRWYVVPSLEILCDPRPHYQGYLKSFYLKETDCAFGKDNVEMFGKSIACNTAPETELGLYGQMGWLNNKHTYIDAEDFEKLRLEAGVFKALTDANYEKLLLLAQDVRSETGEATCQ